MKNILYIIILSFLFSFSVFAEDTKERAEQGDAAAQFNLALMYDSGQGVTQDYKKALKWYRLAAEQGYLSAQYNLGWMHTNGRGVIQDLVLVEFVNPARIGFPSRFIHPNASIKHKFPFNV